MFCRSIGCVAVLDVPGADFCEDCKQKFQHDIPFPVRSQAKKAEVSNKHPHYHKNVSHLETIDIYRVLHLYEVTDPCLQHAIKKLMCAGQRGAKDVSKDIQEAIDSLHRWQEMREEDKQ